MLRSSHQSLKEVGIPTLAAKAKPGAHHVWNDPSVPSPFNPKAGSSEVGFFLGIVVC